LEPVRRRLLVAAASAAAIPICPGAHAASPKRVVLVESLGVLEAAIRPGILARFARNGLAAGRDYVLEMKDLGETGDLDIDRIAREVVASRPDVIMVGNSFRTRAFQKATRVIPIVFFNVGDPVFAGFARNLVRPGANLTGTSNLQTELALKQVELLAEIAPLSRRIGLVYTGDNPMLDQTKRLLALAAERRSFPGFAIITLPYTASPTDIIDAIHKARADAVCIRWGLHESSKPLLGLLTQARLPSVVADFDLPFGGLMSFGERFTDTVERTVDIAARVVRGEAPANVPIDQASKVRLAVNLRTARAIGLAIPASFIARADEVFQ
jgi:putative ABC transport system substrate-binding protein